MRKFEVISAEQWQKDILSEFGFNSCPISEHLKPRRSTKFSAGYDFISPVNITLKAHEMTKIPTGIKVIMEPNDVFQLYPRSGMGFKTGIRLANTLGIVDADYYGNENNEGHMFVKFYNHTDEDFEIHIGDKFAQGIFYTYLVVDDEEEINSTRDGGFGSTGK